MASRNDCHEPQQNLLPRQNNPALDMVLPCLQGHILAPGFHTFQVAGFHQNNKSEHFIGLLEDENIKQKQHS